VTSEKRKLFTEKRRSKKSSELKNEEKSAPKIKGWQTLEVGKGRKCGQNTRDKEDTILYFHHGS